MDFEEGVAGVRILRGIQTDRVLPPARGTPQTDSQLVRISANTRIVCNSYARFQVVRVSSTEFGKEVGHYQDVALSQPVVITRNGRDRTVMISAEEYRRLKRRDRAVIATAELPPELAEAVRQTQMDTRHGHLDDLLTDWTP